MFCKSHSPFGPMLIGVGCQRWTSIATIQGSAAFFLHRSCSRSLLYGVCPSHWPKECPAAGVDDYIGKPLKLEELRSLGILWLASRIDQPNPKFARKLVRGSSYPLTFQVFTLLLSVLLQIAFNYVNVALIYCLAV